MDKFDNKHSDVMQNIAESLIRELFETGQEYTVQEVVKMTQLTEDAVNEILVKLVVRGEIKKVNQSQFRVKYDKYVLNKDHAYKLIIRIRPLVLQYLIYDATNTVIFHKEKSAIDTYLIDTLVQVITDVSKVYNLQVIAIGSAFLLKNGEAISFGYSREFQEFNIKKLLRSKVNVPIVIEKEINAALVGACDSEEMKFLDDEYTACLHISPTRIQCAFMYENVLIKGNEGLAGELGLFDFNEEYTLEQVLQNEFADVSKAQFIARIINIITTAFDPKRLIIYKSKVLPELTDDIIREYINLPYRAKIETTFSHEYDANCERGLLKLAKRELSADI